MSFIRSYYCALVAPLLIFATFLHTTNKLFFPYISHQQFLFSAFILFVFGLVALNLSTQPKIVAIKVSIIDVFVLVFPFFIIIRSLNSNSILYHTSELYTLLVAVIMYVILSQDLKNETSLIRRRMCIVVYCVVVIGLGYIQLFWGILELFKVISTTDLNYSIAGAFINPGPYSNFLIAILPIALGVFLFIEKKQWLIRLFSLGYVLLTLFVLPFTYARTAWIGAIAGIIFIFYVWGKNKLPSFVFQIIDRYRILFLSVLLLSAVTFILWSYELKKDSADGRLNIWKTSIDLITEKPFFGYGYNTFCTFYNNKLVETYSQKKQLDEPDYLVNSAIFAFNDYIQILVELGIVGLILFLLPFVLIYIGIKKYKISDGENGSLIKYPLAISIAVIFICSMFSYPLYVPAILVFVLMNAGVLSGYIQQKSYSFKITSKFRIISNVIVLFVLVVLAYNQVEITKQRLKWGSVNNHLTTEKTSNILKNLEDVSEALKYESDFLYNYGVLLAKLGQHEKSIEILTKASIRINSQELYIYQGLSYETLGNYEKAEECYLRAKRTVPYLIIPKYLIFKLYQKSDNQAKALEMAKEIIDTKIKVYNPEIGQIKQEVLGFVELNTNK